MRLAGQGKEEKNQDWLPVTGMRFQNGEPIIGLLLLSTSLLRSSSFSTFLCLAAPGRDEVIVEPQFFLSLSLIHLSFSYFSRARGRKKRCP